MAEERDITQITLDAICDAVDDNLIAVTEMKLKTGEVVRVLVAVVPDDEGSQQIFPLARLFLADPFDELETPEGAVVTRPADKNKDA